MVAGWDHGVRGGELQRPVDEADGVDAVRLDAFGRERVERRDDEEGKDVNGDDGDDEQQDAVAPAHRADPGIHLTRVTFPPSSGAATATRLRCLFRGRSVEPLQEPCHQAVDPERSDPGAGEEADEHEDR